MQYVFFTDLYRKTISMESSCSTFLLVSGVLGGLLFISAFLMCYLASRLQTALATRYHSNNLDQFVRDHSRKCSMSETYGYTGRSTIQWSYRWALQGNPVRLPLRDLCPGPYIAVESLLIQWFWLQYLQGNSSCLPLFLGNLTFSPPSAN